MILDVHAELLSMSLQHTVAEKVELDVLVLPPPVVILAVDNSGLLRMKLQSAFGKATPDGFQHRSCFLLAPAVDDGVVRVTLDPDARILSLHPEVERVVQEQVGQQRTDDPSLRGPLRPLHESAVPTFDRGAQPPPNIQADPSQIRVAGQGTLDEVMRNGIKEGSDVQIDDPVAVPAPFPRHSHRVKRRAARSIAVGVGVEPGFHLWLHDHLDHCLRHAVGNGRNAERARAAVVLRYLDEPHGWRMVRTRRHPIPDLMQVALQVLLECRQGHAVHARSAAVRLHPLVGFPDELLRNAVRLCLRHRLLPSRVGQHPQLESRVPSLRPHYQASSLLRTRPPLRPASVLGASRVFRLAISLSIGATGSHVPHKSLSLVSRRLHAGRRSASRQASSELRPRPTTGAWFRRRSNAFDTSSTVHSRSSYQRTPDEFSSPFPQRSLPQPLCRRSLRWFGP